MAKKGASQGGTGKGRLKEKNVARASYMKKNPGQFPDSMRPGGWRGNSHDGTMDAKRLRGRQD